jgi:hypothetical protein
MLVVVTAARQLVSETDTVTVETTVDAAGQAVDNPQLIAVTMEVALATEVE